MKGALQTALNKSEKQKERPVGRDTRGGFVCFTKCVNEMAHISDSWGVCWLLTIEKEISRFRSHWLSKNPSGHSERQCLISTYCDIDIQMHKKM